MPGDGADEKQKAHMAQHFKTRSSENTSQGNGSEAPLALTDTQVGISNKGKGGRGKGAGKSKNNQSCLFLELVNRVGYHVLHKDNLGNTGF